MPRSGPVASAHLIPLMRYRDVGVASEWLCAAFGFEPHFAAKAPDGSVFYAELKFEESMVMLGAAGVPALDALMQPGSPGAPSEAQQSCYVIVDDIVGHYEQAKRTGAAIVLDLKNDDVGGSGYSCRDPEGHVWNFGTYNPWKAQSQGGKRKKRRRSASSEMPGYRTAMAGTILVSVLSGWVLYGYVRGGLDLQRLREALIGPPQNELSTGGIGEMAGAKAAKDAQAEVSRAHRAMQALQAQLDRERQAKAAAQQEASAARADAGRVASEARAEAEKVTAEARRSAEKSAAEARDAAAKAAAEARASSEKMIAELTEKSKQDLSTAARKGDPQTNASIAVLKTEIARQHETMGQISADLKSLQKELEDAQAERDAAIKAVADAKDTTERERAEKDAAMKALADAGARIATLEVELKKVKLALQQANTARAVARARSATPAKKSKDLNEVWPYSEW